MIRRRGLIVPRRPLGLRLRNYISLSRLPTPPDAYGRDMSGVTCQMLNNDQLGDCVPAAQQNAVIVWNWANKILVPFDNATSIALYSFESGYVPGNPSTDQGTDIETAGNDWKTTGVKDASGTSHKIDDYLWIDKGDVDMHVVADYLFEVLLVGLTIGDNQEAQFEANEPWSGDLGSDPGGHCVAFKGRNAAGQFLATTWARWEQEIEDSFLADEGCGSIVPLQKEMLVKTQSLEGFDYEALASDLAALRQETA